MKMNQHGAFAFLLIVSLLVNDSEQLFGKRRKRKWGCDRWPRPNYSRCRLGLGCDPRLPNSCPCPHACCRVNTESGKWTGIGIRIPIGRKRQISVGGASGKLPVQPSYICYKKGECGKKCGQPWAKFNKVDKCGCGVGLTCKKNSWIQSRRCRYD